MMRYLRYLFLALLGIGLIAVALANRGLVELRALPLEAGEFLGLGWAIQLPLFLVIFASILVGLLIGFVWEWTREYRIRADAARTRREADRLAREVSKLRETSHGPQDEVLALLDKPGRAR